MADNKINVGGRLHSIATGNVLAGANEILDDSKNKKQSDINTETYSLVNDVNERLNGLSPDQQSALNVAAKATNNETKLGYYVCGTDGNVAAKVISDATGYILSKGGSIKIKMTNANTANNATLNINSTGAKALYYDGERASANNSWEAGETVEVYYDGTNFYANNIAGNGGDGVFDVSEKYPTSGVEGGNTYTLNGALTVLNANLPTSKKKGGMSIKFVQSSDNKYVQFRFMLSGSFTTAQFTNVANWQGEDILLQSLQNLFIGRANTLSLTKIYGLIPQHKYRLWFENPRWSRTEVPSTSGNVLVNVTYTSSGVDTDLIKVVVGSTIKAYYDFTTPETFDYVSIGGKADNGVKVRFALEDLAYTNTHCEEEFEKANKGLAIHLGHSGNVNIDTINHVLDLGSDPQLIIGNDCFALKAIWPNDSTKYRNIDYKNNISSSITKVLFNRTTKEFRTVIYDGALSDTEVVIGVFKTGSGASGAFVNANLPFEYTINGLNRYITGIDNEPTPESDAFVKSGDINKVLAKNLFVGNGNTFVTGTKIYGLSKKTKYRIIFEKVPWPVTQSSSGSYILRIGSVIGSAATQYFLGKTTNSVLEPYYIFETPETFDYIVVDGRADTGTTVRFTIVPEPTFSSGEHIGAVSITSRLDKDNEGLIKGNEVAGQLYNNYFIGNDNNFVENCVVRGIIPNAKYRLWIAVDEWDRSNVTVPSGSKILQITAYDKYNNSLGYVKNITIQTTPEYMYEITTPANTSYLLVGGRATIGTKVRFGLQIIDLLSDNIPEVVTKNLDKTTILNSACRLYHKNDSSKDLQACIITDTHSVKLPIKNAIDLTNHFSTIDALFCMGDINLRWATENDIEAYITLMASCNKPIFNVVGNHDVGNTTNIAVCNDHQQIYDRLIAPMVTAGTLVSGEYETGKPYYYHDFVNEKIRLIGIYEYDDNLDLANSDYWEPVPYNSSYSRLAYNHQYSVGDYVNAGVYTDYSFKCIQAVKTNINPVLETEKVPQYKVTRGYRVIRQTQAQWFLDTLASTPANYAVVVLLHTPFSRSASLFEGKFNQLIDGITAAYYSQDYMETDFIADAVNAFITGSNYQANIEMRSAAAYMNTEGGGTYAYSVSKDFSAKNTGVQFMCFIGGHCHRDHIFKHNTYNLYQVCPILTGVQRNYNDVCTDYKVVNNVEQGENVDRITTVSFDTDNRTLGLARLGVDSTIDMKKRDMERLSL